LAGGYLGITTDSARPWVGALAPSRGVGRALADAVGLDNLCI
jgi:hypothetical protein